MMYSKSRQLQYRNRKPKTAPPKRNIAEAPLQKFTDDYLSSLNLKYFRIPDGVWRWLHFNAHGGILAWFRWCFGGMADNTIFIPIGEYSLCLHLELKSTVGKLHGRQKAEAKALPWKIARTPEEVMEHVQKFIQIAAAQSKINKINYPQNSHPAK